MTQSTLHIRTQAGAHTRPHAHTHAHTHTHTQMTKIHLPLKSTNYNILSTLTNTHKKCMLFQHFKGSQLEWCISAIYHAWDTPFWSGTLEHFEYAIAIFINLWRVYILRSIHSTPKILNTIYQQERKSWLPVFVHLHIGEVAHLSFLAFLLLWELTLLLCRQRGLAFEE